MLSKVAIPSASWSELQDELDPLGVEIRLYAAEPGDVSTGSCQALIRRAVAL